MDNACKDNIYDYKVIYDEIKFKASNWSEKRRIAVKIENPEWKMCYNYTFVVANMLSISKQLIMFYLNRGNIENFIKESKNASLSIH